LFSSPLFREVLICECKPIPRHTSKNPIAGGDGIFARNCEGTEQLRTFRKIVTIFQRNLHDFPLENPLFIVVKLLFFQI
ncbi:hypothetical protein RFX70_16175, partial [Acinetobacter baumannii]|nr:hypothetical protein [Acinetobacter baumannii]